jgi:hypothetical protein
VKDPIDELTSGPTERIITVVFTQEQYNMLCFMMGMATAVIHERPGNYPEMLDEAINLLNHIARASR